MLPIILGGTGLILASLYMQGPTNNVSVRSTLDNKEYKVQNLPDKQEAANLLSKIKKNLIEIMDDLKSTQHNPPYERLYARFNPENLEENDISASSTSYSENKGEKIIVCMRDKTKEPYPFVDENTIMFVLLHELAHLMTESIGQNLFGDALPWGRWPWTMHSAFWGMFVQLAVCLPISAMTQNSRDRSHRQKYHDFLADHAGLPASKQSLKPAAWIITIAWLFFGIGPGAVIGNDIFGSPNDISTWTFGIPSIWAWQILFWLLGTGMMWFLAYKMEMSTMPRKSVSALVDDIGDSARA